MKRIVVVLALAAVLAGLVSASLAAAAPSPQKSPTHYATSEQFGIGFVLDDTEGCNGELIELTGNFHTVNQFWLQPDGTYHVISHFNIMNAKGVGIDPETGEPTGNTYRIPSASNVVENKVQSGQTVSGTVTINMVISKGSAPNDDAVATVHYILDETGMVKAEVIQFHVKCTGSGGATSPPAPIAPPAPTAPPTPTTTPTPTASAAATDLPQLHRQLQHSRDPSEGR